MLLRSLASAIEPTRKEVAEASASQQRVRALLESGNIGAIVENSFLIGSYARRTAVSPIDDIDVIVQVDAEHWQSGWSFLPDPADVIASIHRAVKHRYPDSKVRKQRRSVGLRMSRRAIDIVPALQTEEDGIYLIPDTVLGDWIETAPQHHAEAVSEINQKRHGLLIPMIKLVKFWNSQLPDTVRMKSFGVETLVAQFFDHYSVDDLGQSLYQLLDFIVYCGPFNGPAAELGWDDDLGVSLGHLQQVVPDLTDLDNNAVAGTSADSCIKFVNKCRINRDRVKGALCANTESSVKRHLQAIFGCDFH